MGEHERVLGRARASTRQLHDRRRRRQSRWNSWRIRLAHARPCEVNVETPVGERTRLGKRGRRTSADDPPTPANVPALRRVPRPIWPSGSAPMIDAYSPWNEPNRVALLEPGEPGGLHRPPEGRLRRRSRRRIRPRPSSRRPSSAATPASELGLLPTCAAPTRRASRATPTSSAGPAIPAASPSRRRRRPERSRRGTPFRPSSTCGTSSTSSTRAAGSGSWRSAGAPASRATSRPRTASRRPSRPTTSPAPSPIDVAISTGITERIFWYKLRDSGRTGTTGSPTRACSGPTCPPSRPSRPSARSAIDVPDGAPLDPATPIPAGGPRAPDRRGTARPPPLGEVGDRVVASPSAGRS